MQVFVTGANGLIGRELLPRLRSSGHQITRLVRRTSGAADERVWDPAGATLGPQVLDGCDALIHLAGENIGEGRWTEEKKRRIRESRVHSTRLLANAIQAREVPPKAFVVASAIGYYGDRGTEVLTESSPAGHGFLPEVCVEWEQAADPARDRCRVVHVRTGVVLSRQGGALQQMLLPFKFGVGGVIGSGDQYWSWISLPDIARLFQFALEHDSVRGPINGVAPDAVTNREFTKTLGRVLNRPTVLPMPAFAAKLALGEMAEALILASTRVTPQAAKAAGFDYEHATLESALRATLD